MSAGEAQTATALITLLTDFGLRDGYVGAMKGVIATWAPAVRVVDITHEIPPQDLRQAGLVWAQATRFFPPGAVHVAVVDPGVGSRRKIIAVEARGSFFLAPDNGLVGYVLDKREIRRVVEVRREEYFLQPVSATFHGRDIFAPVAARLASGLPLGKLGPSCRRYRWDGPPRVRSRTRRVGGKRYREQRGEVIHVDSFGNAVTNIEPREDRRLERFEIAGLRFCRIRRTYSDESPGTPLILVGSSGFIEVAVNRGSAARECGLDVGDRVTAVWR